MKKILLINNCKKRDYNLFDLKNSETNNNK